MIPVLYGRAETDYSHNGVGLLTDCLSCEVTEERNGAFELVLRYPADGTYFPDMAEGCLIKAAANETSDPQVFRLYRSTTPINGVVTWYGQHISYDLNDNPVLNYSVAGVTPSQALAAALSQTVYPHGFTSWSDIASTNSAAFAEPLPVRAIFGGRAGSLLDRWGGEYEFDNRTVKLHARRGADTDVVIEYGKNLTDIRQERNIADTYTALLPWAKYTENTAAGTVERVATLPEKVLPAPGTFEHDKALVMDFTGEFESGQAVTADSLRAKARAYMAANPIHIPKVSISAAFVQLWQSPEYADIAPLERVRLCDTVTIRFSRLGIEATAKVIKTVYDSLKERYVKIDLGDARSNFADTVNRQQQEIGGITATVRESEIQAGNALQEAIRTATDAITGNSGGYVVHRPANNPQEILIMDTPDVESALKVLRLNNAGIAGSVNGINGPYSVAMLIDGRINASQITTGTLNADVIKAGVLQSANGQSWINMATGRFSFGNGALVWDGTTFKSLNAERLTTAGSAYSGVIGSYTSDGTTQHGILVFKNDTLLASLAGYDGATLDLASGNKLCRLNIGANFLQLIATGNVVMFSEYPYSGTAQGTTIIRPMKNPRNTSGTHELEIGQETGLRIRQINSNGVEVKYGTGASFTVTIGGYTMKFVCGLCVGITPWPS